MIYQKKENIVNSPIIKDIIFYLSESVVIFKIIQSEKQRVQPSIYIAAGTTLPEGEVNTAVFCDSYTHRIQHFLGEKSRARSMKVSDYKLDCFSISIFSKDIPGQGDVLTFDLNKYLGNAATTAATVELDIISKKKISNLSSWEMRSPLLISQDERPLIFRSIPVKEKSIKKSLESFKIWINKVQDYSRIEKEAEIFVKLINKLIKNEVSSNYDIMNFLDIEIFKNWEILSYRFDNLINPLVITFDWGE